MPAIPLTAVLSTLETIAPLRHAAPWDNVGLLLQPTADASVRRVLLTIDLTEPVVEEALEGAIDLIVAYHPPIFGGLKRLTQAAARQRALLIAARRGVAIYSPHTAADAAQGGVNDWLLEGLGAVRDVTPIEPATANGEPTPGVGMGRVARLDAPAPLHALLTRLKAHLGLDHLRVAAAARHEAGAPVERVAVCPGAGGSLFEGLRGPDLFVTGEMRHHDVLAKVAGGASVVLTEHTNCERGWLGRLASRMRDALELDVRVSTRDHDPLKVR